MVDGQVMVTVIIDRMHNDLTSCNVPEVFVAIARNSNDFVKLLSLPLRP